jgi:hypothetical protein
LTESCQNSRRERFTRYLLSVSANNDGAIRRASSLHSRNNLIFSLTPIPQHSNPVLWKEGTSMSRSKASSRLFPDSVTEINGASSAQPSRDTVRGTATVSPVPIPVEANSLPLDWVLNPDKGTGLSERVLARLLLAEAKSGDPYEKLAYRLAWHIALHCMKGDAVECSPVTLAYYSVVGCHEEQYYDRLMIRRAAMFGDGNRIPFPSPKKPAKAISEKKERSA